VSGGDPYTILGVPPTATVAEIREAYRRLARRYHPDRNPGRPYVWKRMARINVAYEALADARPGARYDYRCGSEGPRENRRREADAMPTGEAHTHTTAAGVGAVASPNGLKWRHWLFAGWVAVKAIMIISALT